MAAVDVMHRAGDAVVPRLLLMLQYTRQHAAALRLSARILRGPADAATTRGRDLTNAALLVAASRHNGLLAALELAAEAHNRAAALVSRLW